MIFLYTQTTASRNLITRTISIEWAELEGSRQMAWQSHSLQMTRKGLRKVLWKSYRYTGREISKKSPVSKNSWTYSIRWGLISSQEMRNQDLNEKSFDLFYTNKIINDLITYINISLSSVLIQLKIIESVKLNSLYYDSSFKTINWHVFEFWLL